METNYKYKYDLPYSLHDMTVNNIAIKKDSIHLYFDNGFEESVEPYTQVNGHVVIENPDYDFAFVYLIKYSSPNKNGEYEKFKGKQMKLKKFLKKNKWKDFEIVDELYGYNEVCYNGYLSSPKKDTVIELQLYIYHTGNIVYVTD